MTKTKGTLILTCAHAIFTGINPLLESHWLLAPFQQSRREPSLPKKESEHFTFLRHIIASVLELLSVNTGHSSSGRSSSNERSNQHPVPAHVIFSGGATKRSQGCEMSEGASYLAAFRWMVERGGDLVSSASESAEEVEDVPEALRQDMSRLHAALASYQSARDGTGLDDLLARHIHTETLATDSFQNMLFGMLHFRSIAGSWPEKVLVVTHGFKRRRVVDLHAQALKMAKERIEVVGIDPPFAGEAEEEEVRRGEMGRGYGAFEGDLYGCKSGGMLGVKRVERGWGEIERIAVVERYLWNLESEDGRVVERLLEWDGGEDGRDLFAEKLPWEDG